MSGRRKDGTNLRALGLSPRQLGVSKRQLERRGAKPTQREEAAKLRRGVPKWLRFEVLKRDKFTCQYCGAKSPKVALHVDHVVPFSAAANLKASCENCNGGKSNVLLSEARV